MHLCSSNPPDPDLFVLVMPVTADKICLTCYIMKTKTNGIK